MADLRLRRRNWLAADTAFDPARRRFPRSMDAADFFHDFPRLAAAHTRFTEAKSN
jgi:hypothetical protein